MHIILFVQPSLHTHFLSVPALIPPLSTFSLSSLTIFDLPLYPASLQCLASHPLPQLSNPPTTSPPLSSSRRRLLPLLHWPGRSVSLSSSPPPPPASACGPSHPEASFRPLLASSAPPLTSAAESAPPSPGRVGRGERRTDGEERIKNNRGYGETGRIC